MAVPVVLTKGLLALTSRRTTLAPAHIGAGKSASPVPPRAKGRIAAGCARRPSGHLGALVCTLALPALALAAMAVPTGAAAAHVDHGKRARPLPCRPAHGTTTIAHSATARIFADERNGNDYACLYRSGHARYLSSTEHFEYRLVRFAGPYVAFAALVEDNHSYVGVMNLRTGQQQEFGEGQEVAPIMLAPSECPSAVPDCAAVCPLVASLVLRPDGAVAWIATNFLAGAAGIACPKGPTPAIEVRGHDRSGLRVIASGPGILTGSLRLRGSSLRWANEGRAETTTLY